MAYVVSCPSDVFISYAQVDDAAPPFAGAIGPVARLVAGLRGALPRNLPRGPAPALWWDQRDLAGNADLDPAVRDAARGTAVMVAVLSQRYLESPWCTMERDVFLAAVDADVTRLFIVELEPIKLAARPPALQRVRGYKFWADDGQHGPVALGQRGQEDVGAYTVALEVLARDIARRLADLARAHRGPRWLSGPKLDHALEVVPGQRPKAAASGYAIASGIAITALRGNARAARDLWCRAMHGDWMQTTLVAHAQHIAVLSAAVENGAEPVRWARWRGERSIRCACVAVRPPSGKGGRKAWLGRLRVTGMLEAGENVSARTMKMRPDREFLASTRGPEGEYFVGAAVFARGHCVGVIARRIGKSFAIEPLDALADPAASSLPDVEQLPYLEDICVVYLPEGVPVERLQRMLADHLPDARQLFVAHAEDQP
jgi:hypothetical protein